MLDNQAYLFLIFLIDGIIIGLLFDFFRILRKSFKTKDFITYIEDFLFWVITGFIVLYSIFTFNNGEIRLYIFIGIILGISIYMLSISKYVMKICVLFISVIKKIIGSITKIVFYPFKLFFKAIKKILLKPIIFIKERIKIIFDSIIQNIKKSKQKNVEN